MTSIKGRESSTPSPSPLSEAVIAQWTANPFWQLPVEFRIPAWEFWAFWSQQLKDGQLALATRLRQWIESGLTLADAKSCFAAVNDPARSANITHGGELLAMLGGLVDTANQQRRKREKEARFKAETEAAKRGAVSGDEVRRLLGSATIDAGGGS